MKTILTIAGSDCSGGAGIQADIKTITAHKMYAMSAITALTAQNTTGVFAIQESSPQFLGEQLDAIFSDIFPDAVKIGMVASKELIQIIAEKLTAYQAKNIVLDPVMVATSGGKLLATDATKMLISQLLPLANIITPNIPEAESLSGIPIEKPEDMIKAAALIGENIPGQILIKGGHLDDSCNDLLYHDGTAHWFKGERIATKNTHGTGCTLSSAIACNLAMGHSMEDSVANAKAYITGALKHEIRLGKGNGPVNHCWNL